MRHRVIIALAEFVKKMHQAGMATPDLFTRHIFLANESSAPQFCFIDMARLDRCKNPSARTRARDLAALNVTASPEIVSARERILFLRAYAGDVDRQLFNFIRRRMKRLLTRKKHRRAFLGDKL
jgi:tRNA A-37 threonylcarbamoyl transferase component Bud32